MNIDVLSVNLFEILQCFSDAVDMVLPEFANHQRQVGNLAFRIAQHMELDENSMRNVLMAGLVHDIGAISVQERLEIIESEPVSVHSHGFRAARMLEEFGPFSLVADIVRYHHLPWANGEGRFFRAVRFRWRATSSTWRTAYARESSGEKIPWVKRRRYCNIFG